MDQQPSPPPFSQSPASEAERPLSGLSIASLVLGILSYVGFLVFASVPGVVCGHLARKQIREDPMGVRGEGMALAGLILSYVNIALTILFCIIAIVVMMFSVKTAVDEEPRVTPNQQEQQIDARESLERVIGTYRDVGEGQLPAGLDEDIAQYQQELQALTGDADEQPDREQIEAQLDAMLRDLEGR